MGMFLAVLTTLTASACQSPEVRGDKPEEPPRAFSETLLLADFDDLTPETFLDTDLFLSGELEATQVLTGAGRLRVVAGAGGAGLALRYPDTAGIARGERAALHVAPDGAERLAPEEADFAFGADVFYGELPTDTAADNGDNVLQRGLFADVGQFKLQLDQGRPGCRVAGTGGEVLVKAQDTLRSGTWYRLRCQRVEDTLSLFVAPLSGRAPLPGSEAEQNLDWLLWQRGGETGSVTVSDPPATLSIGGKLNAQGGIVENSPDQFSGELDNVIIGLVTSP